MFLNYFKLSLRLLARNPFFTFINVAGLSVGFATFFVLWAYSRNEMAADRFHPDWERTVRVCNVVQWTDDGTNWVDPNDFGTSPAVMANYLVNLYPEIESFTRTLPQILFDNPGDGGNTTGHGREVLISYINSPGERKTFKEENIIYADPNFFNFFSITVIKGDASIALKKGTAILLSQTKADIYFGKEDPLGKALLLNHSIPFMVAGVFEDVTSNSHFDFDIVLSTERIKDHLDRPHHHSWAYSYLKFKPNVDINDLLSRINKDQREFIHHSFWGNWQFGKVKIFFQPLKDIAFDHLRNDVHSGKSKSLLIVLGVAAWVVLGMAWINYMIQSVSFNFKRDKEQLIRRIVGSNAGNIAQQFLAESLVIHFISLLTSFTIIQLAQSPLHLLFGFYIPTWSSIPMGTKMLMIAVLSVSIVLICIFPLINSLLRIKLTRQMRFSGNRSDFYYNSLNSIQFALAITLIICTFCVYQQNRFIVEKSIGLNRQNILLIDLPPEPAKTIDNRLVTFLQSMSNVSEVSAATVSYSVAGNEFHNYVWLKRLASTGGLNVESDGGVSANFIPFYGIKLLSGRNFIEDNPADSSTIILSLAAINRLGFKNPEEALGQKIDADEKYNIEIVGIIEDYQLRPLLKSIYTDEGYEGKPGLALTYKDYVNAYAKYQIVSVKIKEGHESETIAKIEQLYKEFFPQGVFRFSFLDGIINNQYLNYKTLLNQMSLFAVLAIGIAVIGLTGIFAKRNAARVKEIGIRKVLGANNSNLLYLLIGGTLRQFIIATLGGLLISYFINQEYQREFTEKFEMPLWQYLIPVFMFSLIMSVTIGFVVQSVIKNNPVEALKHE